MARPNVNITIYGCRTSFLCRQAQREFTPVTRNGYSGIRRASRCLAEPVCAARAFCR